MSGHRTLRIGTRASALALWQARHVESLIKGLKDAPPVEVVHIKTEGDVRTDVPLWALKGRAFFTKEIDRALLAGEVDLAVHSLKDLSTVLEPGLELAATLTREDPRDALLTRGGLGLADLPPGARVGTSSLRRRAFLGRARPDLNLLELRGNVPTRIERLKAGDYDAIVLAAAGLRRLGLHEHIAELLLPDDFPPAVSQGVVGVCCRAGDAETLRWLRPLDDLPARLATTAERSLLRRLEGGCQVPLGALGTSVGGTLHLYAGVCALDGSEWLTARGESDATPEMAVALGQRIADELVEKGAARLIAHERSSHPAAEGA
ncbi:MAG TPA: hydroxymethylbilane synthase [Steroidobacteraceae bacterium]|nr:hydroxymethylbilane synthase [Steroidobacteraceae bacterium]